jgi:hypothetical protein
MCGANMVDYVGKADTKVCIITKEDDTTIFYKAAFTVLRVLFIESDPGLSHIYTVASCPLTQQDQP